VFELTGWWWLNPLPNFQPPARFTHSAPQGVPVSGHKSTFFCNKMIKILHFYLKIEKISQGGTCLLCYRYENSHCCRLTGFRNIVNVSEHFMGHMTQTTLWSANSQSCVPNIKVCSVTDFENIAEGIAKCKCSKGHVT